MKYKKIRKWNRKKKQNKWNQSNIKPEIGWKWIGFYIFKKLSWMII